MKDPTAETVGSFCIRGLERREVEKRFYGGERKRLTASATFLFIRYLPFLNGA
jgi:hypothetical protein